MNVYEDIYEIIASFGMNIVVTLAKDSSFHIIRVVVSLLVKKLNKIKIKYDSTT